MLVSQYSILKNIIDNVYHVKFTLLSACVHTNVQCVYDSIFHALNFDARSDDGYSKVDLCIDIIYYVISMIYGTCNYISQLVVSNSQLIKNFLA